MVTIATSSTQPNPLLAGGHSFRRRTHNLRLSVMNAAFLPLIILILTPQISYQTPSDVSNRQRFKGTWIFDMKKSDVHQVMKERYEGQTLELSYNEPELRMTKTQARINPKTKTRETKAVELVFFTDNRGEKNRPNAFLQDFEVTSNSFWSKDVLIRNYTIKTYQSGKVVGGFSVEETYTLSDDANTLTIVEASRSRILTDSPNGELRTGGKDKIKFVYVRKT